MKSKVLYVSHSGAIAGAETCLLTLLDYLDRDRFEPVVTVPWNGLLREKIEGRGVKLHLANAEWWIRPESAFGRGRMNIAGCVDEIRRVIEIERPAIVHTNSSVVLSGALAAREAGIPHIWHVHEMLVGHPGLASLFPLPLIYWMMNALSDRIVTVSDAARRPLASGVDLERLVTIHNGVAMTRPSSERIPLHRELSLPPDAIVIATIGRLGPEKGYDNLLRAASRAKERGARVCFVIVGGGLPVETASLTRKIESLSLKGSVHYLGERDDVSSVLESIDLLVVPSLTESFCLAAVEAMAMRRPVVATDCGGPSEIVVDGETGLIVPVNDSERLCDAIIELASNKRRRKEMGEKGFNRYVEKFRAEIYALEFEALYDEVLHSMTRRSDADREIAFFLTSVYQNLNDCRGGGAASPEGPSPLRRLLSPRRWARRIGNLLRS